MLSCRVKLKLVHAAVYSFTCMLNDGIQMENVVELSLRRRIYFPLCSVLCMNVFT